MSYNILVVEDDDSIGKIVKMTLEIEEHNVFYAMDGKKALEFINSQYFDLAILDIMLPHYDGYQLLEKLKKRDIPVIFLTAKSELHDKVKGLRSGAEDYITKPFETLELLARVDTVLRRINKNSNILTAKNIVLDMDKHVVTKDDEVVYLTPLEYELLENLMRNQGLLFSRDQLLDIVWGYEYTGGTRTVDTHIQKLRSKLDLGDTIKTVHKIGYKFEVNKNE